MNKLSKIELSSVLSVMARRGQSLRSQQQARTIIKLALRHAYENDYINHNPADGLRSVRVDDNPMTPLSVDEVFQLLNKYNTWYMCARLHIALVCGLRQGEALGLRWKDIDLENGLIHVRQQIQKINGTYAAVPLKTYRSNRTIALPEETSEILQAFRIQVGENELVFCGLNGEPKSSHSDYSDWQKALRSCGIPRRRLHDTRHTAATIMYSSGVGIETISRILGHSSSAITSRLYVHTSEIPLKQAAS